MLDNTLIKTCTCGNTENFEKKTLNNLPVVECKECGVVQQDLPGYDADKYYCFYKNDYHEGFQKNRGTMTYDERYEHDVKVAEARLVAYKYYIHPPQVGLDVGSSNSAFVHTANKQGYNCMGLEPGENIGDDAYTIRGTLDSVDLQDNYYDFVTMHDSIEHMIDVNSALAKIFKSLKSNGRLLLDLPDYFNKAGKHHWKPIEHLWFFTEEQFVKIIKSHGFAFDKVTRPIPGKLVFYARKR
jgi:SAM-dependent methyltransferase